MKVVIRTVTVQHYCYYRCTTTAVLLPLYYYRCTTTAVPVWTEIGNDTRSKTSLKSTFSVHSTEPVYTKEKKCTTPSKEKI